VTITAKNYLSTQTSDSFFVGRPFKLPERTVSGPKEANLARRRFQRGQVLLLGSKKAKRWYGRWYEDVLEFGRTRRIRRQEFLGTLKDYPTKRLASRELDARLGTINAPTYRARPTATFNQFADRWEADVIPQFKPSTASNYRLHVRKHLKPFFGCYQLKDIGPEMVQRFVSVASQKAAPKTVRNLCVTLQSMWRSARAWHYVAHDVFDGVVLPRPRQPQRFFFSAEDVQKIISSAREPRRKFYGLLAETGLRVGELCGLTIDDIDLERGASHRAPERLAREARQPEDGKECPGCRPVARMRGERSCVSKVMAFQRITALVCEQEWNTVGCELDVEASFQAVTSKARNQCAERQWIPCFSARKRNLDGPVWRLGHTDSRMTLNVYTHVAGEDAKYAASQLGSVVWGRTFEVSDVNGRKIKTA